LHSLAGLLSIQCMYSRHSRDRPFLASRGAALVGIIALHAGAAALAYFIKGPRADVVTVSPPMQVMMIDAPESAPAPDLAVPQPEVTPAQLVMPLINIDMPVTPSTAITAVVAAPPPSPPPAARVAEPDTSTPITIAEAAWVRMPSPVYPRAAMQAKAQGVVHVRALVDEKGQAREARVHRSSGFTALDRAACESVLAALFRPYLHNGVARSVDVIVPVTFALKQRGGGGPGRRPPVGPGNDRPADLELDVRREDHHAVSGHPEELGSLGTTALHVGE
jgi:TonB family protein